MTSKIRNLLPYDGWATYRPQWLAGAEAGSLYTNLREEINWQSDVVHIFGKRIVTRRKVAWYGDERFDYSYSNTKREALPWTARLLRLREMVSEAAGTAFNSCLLNLYHSGEEGMGWHSDDEKELVKDGTIASISLGAERPFVFKHKKTKEKVEVMLQSGSLLLMGGVVQQYWQHSLPKRKRIGDARINLTFRMIDTGP